MQDDGRPLNMLEDRMRIGFDPLKTLLVFLSQNDLCSLACCHGGSTPVENCTALAGSDSITRPIKMESRKMIIALI